ncbi:MAG TPA: hypothetical protein P5063_07370, partial [Methanomassiliicoccales archaeon]|nr:hypothetical protein [Methanomassiliicoccales archaeon]
MLEHVDPGKRLDQKGYDKAAPGLKERLGELQRRARDAGMPIIVIFEGWDTVGMSEIVNRFILPLDPRGFLVHPITAPSPEERARPFLWRFMVRIPARGRIAVFDRSWYFRSLARAVERKEEDARAVWREIADFEEMLSNDGYLIMKFFLHIGKKEHRKRLERYRGSDMDMCAISMAEVELFKKYDRMLPLIEEMLEATDREHAPWTIVEAEDQRFASVKVLASSVQMVERGLALREGRSQASMDGLAGDDRQFSSLRAKADLAVSIPQEEYRARLEELQGRVAELQCALNRQKVPTVIVFE